MSEKDSTEIKEYMKFCDDVLRVLGEIMGIPENLLAKSDDILPLELFDEDRI